MEQFEVMRLPTFANDKEFTHIPDHVRQDLDSLTRECVVYGNSWIEEVEDFRHVRIRLTPEEREEYVRRCWAFELFLRADRPKWAADVPGIDPQIAHDADTYSIRLRNGTEIPPPYHCFAAFLGKDLETIKCSITDRVTVIELEGRESILFEVRLTIKSLTPTIRSFNHRERGLKPWKVTCEDDVRDLLYVMLRPRVFDLTKEEAIPSKAGSHKFADLCSKAVPFMIELKWIGSENSWKRKIDEIYVDIQTYGQHPSSENLIFVIVDSIKDIPDPRQVEADLTEVQVIDGREIDIKTIICET